MISSAFITLLYEIGKVAYEQGEPFRSENPGLMDAYEVACEELKRNCGLEVKNDPNTYKNKTWQQN